MVSFELRSQKTNELASAEIGYIVGGCYTCISLFEVEGRKEFERCGRVRAAAAAELLAQAGVQLIDVGTTAGYYAQQFGFARFTRAEFVQMWRKHRDTVLPRLDVLSNGADDVSTLLQSRLAASDASGSGGGGRVAAGAGAGAGGSSGASVGIKGTGSRANNNLLPTSTKVAATASERAKVTVKICGLLTGTSEEELAELMVQNSVTSVQKVHVAEKIHTGFVVLDGEAGQLAAALRMDGKSVCMRKDSGVLTTIAVTEHGGKTKKRKKKGGGDANVAGSAAGGSDAAAVHGSAALPFRVTVDSGVQAAKRCKVVAAPSEAEPFSRTPRSQDLQAENRD